MRKNMKRIYKPFIWFFSTVIAAGTFLGCGTPSTKYGPPQIQNQTNTTINSATKNQPASDSSSIDAGEPTRAQR